jgi:hypothetical protein
LNSDPTNCKVLQNLCWDQIPLRGKGPLEVGRIALLETLSSGTSGDQQVYVPAGQIAYLSRTAVATWPSFLLSKLSCTCGNFDHFFCTCHNVLRIHARSPLSPSYQ